MKSLNTYITEKLKINKDYKDAGLSKDKLKEIAEYILKMFGCNSDGAKRYDTDNYDILVDTREYNDMIDAIVEFLDEIVFCGNEDTLQFIVQGTVGKSNHQSYIPWKIRDKYKRVQVFGRSTGRNKIYDADDKDQKHSLKLYTHRAMGMKKWTLILWYGDDIERGCVITDFNS